jgi:hypothetical protein
MMRKARPFVVARHDKHRHAALRHSGQWFEGLVRQTWGHLRPIKHIAAVHDNVNLTRQRRRERGLVVGQEIVTTPPAHNAWSFRQIEAEMRVREQQDPDAGRHPVKVQASAFLR